VAGRVQSPHYQCVVIVGMHWRYASAYHSVVVCSHASGYIEYIGGMVSNVASCSQYRSTIDTCKGYVPSTVQ